MNCADRLLYDAWLTPKVTDMNEGGWRRDKDVRTNGVCLTLEVTEYFIHKLSEAD
jgi:hypothetical protein